MEYGRRQRYQVFLLLDYAVDVDVLLSERILGEELLRSIVELGDCFLSNRKLLRQFLVVLGSLTVARYDLNLFFLRLEDLEVGRVLELQQHVDDLLAVVV